MSAERCLDRPTEEPVTLSPHADLKTRHQGDVLVLPERAMRLGGSGGEILRLCVEPRTPAQIIDLLRERHPDAMELEAMTRAFLEEMLELGGLVRVFEGAA